MGLLQETAFMDATAQAELVRRKEVKPIELVDAAIARVEQVNPLLNAVVTPMFELAREAAMNGLPEGPFTGVPFLLKDLLAAFAGVRMTSASRFSSSYIPDQDSELVARLKKAGFVIIGKTNTPEFGVLPTTEPALFGPARNPWNTDHTTGGSSGGSSAAVASGMVPAAHANDGGGSIRIPASCCGLFGLKPTRARNPLGPAFGDMFSGLIAEHAVTRSVGDSAAILDATSGPDLGDPYWAPPKARPYIDELGQAPGTLRIALSIPAANGVPVHPDCVEAAKDAAKLCSDLGHEVEEVALPLDGERIIESFMTLWSAGCTWTVDGFAHILNKKPSAEEMEPLTWALYQMGERRSASQYLLALQMLQAISREIARLFVPYDLLLSPTLAQPPLPIGSFDSPADDPIKGMQVAAAFAPFTPIFNITGQPAMSVPLYWNSQGLPVGAHFAARFGDEATCLD